MSEAPSADPLLGQTLSGRFKILEPLGSGGMGRVYKALQSPLERVVALKVLNPRYNATKDPGFERRFFLEASLTAKLHHPNTITVHDYGRTDDGIYFIAMEYVEGETLAQLLAKHKALSWQRVLNIAGQICRSLREAHKAGMVHRDLKPANVMVLNEDTGSDFIKVLDFGLVKGFMPDGTPAPTDTELTQAGVLLGSPLYMAPEQTKHQADQRSDIYSLGVLMYQCIAGRTPFGGTDSIEIIVKHVREKPVDLQELVPDLPDPVAELVMRCLEKDPAHRFQAMDEVLEAMKAATANTGLSGLFKDPRALTPGQLSAVTSGNVSKPRTASGANLRAASGTHSKPRAKPDMPSSVELTPVSRVSKQSPRAWRFVAVGFGAGLLAIIGGYAIQTIEANKPGPVPMTAQPKPPAQPPLAPEQPAEKPAAPVEAVRITISTVPPGATAEYTGIEFGVTPATLLLKPDERGIVSAEVTLRLEGYEPVTVVAEGPGPEVAVTQTLQKIKAPPKRTKPAKPAQQPAGYKEDPYQ